METLRKIGDWLLSLLSNKSRKLTGNYLLFAQVVAFVTTAFYLYTGIFGVISPELHRGLVLCTTTILILAFFPAHKNSPIDRFSLWDIFLMLLTVASVVYFIWNFAEFVLRFGRFTTLDLVFAWALIIISIEVARRGTGIAVPLLCIVAILYATPWVGPHMPGLLAHRGFTFTRIAVYGYTTFDGVFGSVTSTIATFVIPFVLFGSFMAKTGVGQFFVDLPYAVFSGMKGGVAIVAVVAAMLMGMLSASPTANVLSVGVFVLPLMVKAGYGRETSGGIVAAAACGAMFTPPVMGAVVFFMVEFTGIPYIEIITFAIVPSMLYYIGVLAQAKLNAQKIGMQVTPFEDRPDWKKVLKEGWYLSLPIFVLVYVLALGYTPTRSALAATLACIVVSMFNKKNRMTPQKFIDAMIRTTFDLMVIACIAGAAGMIVGMINLTGLGSKFAAILVQFSGGQLLPTVIITAIAATILGLGTPITAVYIILATLLPPALIHVGVTPAAAHLMLIWFAQLSGITPPVSIVAFAAAAINDSDPLKTGLAGIRYGVMLIFIPFMFVYTRILEVGTIGWAIDSVAAVIAVLFFSGFMQGYWSRKNHVIESMIFGVSAFALFAPGIIYNILGLAGGLSVWAWQRYTIKKQGLTIA